MKKILTIVAVAIIIVGGYFLLNKKQELRNNGSIKIGADFTLSGNASQYGEWAKNAAILAVEKINSESGRKIEIIFEDNKGQTADAISVYRKLKEVDKVNSVMTFISSIALAVEQLANQDKIIQMDISATTPDYSTLNDYSFRTGIVATQLAKESADILFNKLNAKKVILLYINNDFGKGMINVFKNSYKGTIVAEESFDQNGSDFRSQLLKIKTISNADYILLIGHLKESGLLVRQAKDVGIKIPFFSDVYSIEGSDFIKAAGDTGNGLIYVATKFDVNNSNPEVMSFVSAYRERYKTDPNIFAAQTYDGVVALSEAFSKCANLDTDCAKKELIKVDFQGVSGRIKFDQNGDVVKNVELKQVKNGEFVKLEQ